MDQNPRISAMNLLARREHSRAELQQKLLQRDYHLDDINAVLDTLTKEGLQSEERFAESYTRSRFNRGFGPLLIHAELRVRGINEDLIKEILTNPKINWQKLAAEIHKKKFGMAKPENIYERAKQTNFLKYKGFRSEEIKFALGKDFDECLT